MKVRVQYVGWLILLAIGISPVPAAAGTTTYLLRTQSAVQAQAVCQRYGLQLVGNLGKPNIFVVQAPDSVPFSVLQQWVKNDADVQDLETNKAAAMTETPPSDTTYIPTLPMTAYVTDSKLTKLYGTAAWAGYVQQPAMYLMNGAVAVQQSFTGKGVVVAVIDTGVDATNPNLAPVVMPGYDFTRNTAGSATDLADIDPAAAAALVQSTVALLDGGSGVRLNSYSIAFLEQSTVALLDNNNLPQMLGHGTMVAGLIHVAAPQAQIMPLKAFRADGSSSMSDIVRAIYFAVDNGANVINMSFEITEMSDELLRAINYANRKGVICVASAGNDGKHTIVYPAALASVIAVASVNQDRQLSAFSNFGTDLVTVAAPGEGLVTTYFGSHYAAAWGTSFSTALVAGAVADLVDAADSNSRQQLTASDVQRALSNGNGACSTDGDLGSGCVDLYQATHYMHDVHIPPKHRY